MAKRDFVPDRYKNLHDRSANHSAGVGAVATHIGWPTASVTTLKGQLDGLTTATQAVFDAQHALDLVVGQLNTSKGHALAMIRAETKSLKATSGFTEGDAKSLGLYTTPETFDPNTYTPVLAATSRHNYVELMAKKLGADSLNLYWRPAGTATWTMLSPKRARFPFHDDTPAPAGRRCKPASTWRWASSPTRKSATRATLRARCFRLKISSCTRTQRHHEWQRIHS